MRIVVLVAASLVALTLTAGPVAAEDGPCAGTPDNNCRPLCETGDLTDCLRDPQNPSCLRILGITFCP